MVDHGDRYVDERGRIDVGRRGNIRRHWHTEFHHLRRLHDARVECLLRRRCGGSECDQETEESGGNRFPDSESPPTRRSHRRTPELPRIIRCGRRVRCAPRAFTTLGALVVQLRRRWSYVKNLFSIEQEIFSAEKKSTVIFLAGLLQVALMIFLGAIERPRRNDLGHYRRVKLSGFLQMLFRRSRSSVLILIMA